MGGNIERGTINITKSSSERVQHEHPEYELFVANDSCFQLKQPMSWKEFRFSHLMNFLMPLNHYDCLPHSWISKNGGANDKLQHVARRMHKLKSLIFFFLNFLKRTTTHAVFNYQIVMFLCGRTNSWTGKTCIEESRSWPVRWSFNGRVMGSL